MARNNYSYAKRLRELEKQKKKEEKRKRKAEEISSADHQSTMPTKPNNSEENHLP